MCKLNANYNGTRDFTLITLDFTFIRFFFFRRLTDEDPLLLCGSSRFDLPTPVPDCFPAAQPIFQPLNKSGTKVSDVYLHTR